MSSPGSVDVQQRRLSKLLDEVKILISALPNSLPLGAPDGRIATYWSDLDSNHDEGPYFVIDQAWTRTFQPLSAEETAALVTRGEYGIERVYTCIRAFALDPKLRENSCLSLVADKVESLRQLIARR